MLSEACRAAESLEGDIVRRGKIGESVRVVLLLGVVLLVMVFAVGLGCLWKEERKKL